MGGPRRGRETEKLLVGGAVRRQEAYINLLSTLAWFVGPQNNYNSNVKDPWSQITITNKMKMKKLENLQELPKRDTEKLNKWCKNGAYKLQGVCEICSIYETK